MRNVRYADITAIKNVFGAWVCSAIVNNYLVQDSYYFYTKRQAIKLFYDKCNGMA